MFNQREEHYNDRATQWEINRERFAGEEIIDYDDELVGECGEEDLEEYEAAAAWEDSHLLTPDLTDLVRQHLENEEPPF